MKAEPVKDLLVNMQDYVDVANDNAAFMDDHDWGHQIGFLLSANECQEILTKIQSLTEQLEAKDDEMNGLIEIHHEQCKELELEIQSLKEELQKANEIIDQLTKQHP